MIENMKTQCKKCPLQDKSVIACQNRQCKFSKLLPPAPPLPPPRFPMSVGETLEFDGNKLYVFEIYEKQFIFEIVKLHDKSDDDGHNGKYIKQGSHYEFALVSEYPDLKCWALEEASSEHFHETGEYGSSFLLYWNKGSGFSFEIDS